MPVVLATTIMDNAAALLNDQAKQQYTYAIQIPYFNIALSELKELFELSNVPVTDTVSDELEVLAGRTEIGFAPTVPLAIDYLPNDLIEPKVVWARIADYPYTPTSRVDFLPRYEEGVELSQFFCYTWQSQEIRFLACNQNVELKLDYVRDLFSEITIANHATYEIAVINAQSFLQFRIGGLCARFIGENPTRAQELDGDATLALDRALGIGAKGRQRIVTRRRPFRAAYKRRTYA